MRVFGLQLFTGRISAIGLIPAAIAKAWPLVQQPTVTQMEQTAETDASTLSVKKDLY